MVKYHINDEGNPGICGARPDGCPFGGEANHYASKENAREAFELSMAAASMSGKLKKKITSTEAIAAAQEKRRLKDFTHSFSLLNWGSEVTEKDVESLAPTYEMLTEMAQSLKSGSMFERAIKLEKAYKRHMTGPLDPELVVPEDMQSDNYLQVIAPASASVNLAMTRAFERDDWRIRVKDSHFEQNARVFNELLKLDMEKQGSEDEALAKLRAVGWHIEEAGDDGASRRTVRNAIVEGQKVAKTYGAQLKYEQTHLL